MAKGVAVELLVDVDLVALECRVDRVTAAPEVDEIEELEMFLQLVLGDVEALDDLVCGNDRAALLATRREEVREQRLQDGEPFGNDRPGRALAGAVVRAGRRGRPCEL